MKNPEVNSISFSIDAGLIDRLGRELVGRAETAVSELVKNAYDADATYVEVNFINTAKKGGTLKIIDNGLGMNFTQLRSGFMTISSTDKLHNPMSTRFGRNKAGKKGIGRFATQRLGQKLSIVTQVSGDSQAILLEIDWNQYNIDTNLTTIKNQVRYIPKMQQEGTTLIIDSLREAWSEADIKRIYRYVSDLLQPDYISDRSKELGLAKQTNETFKVCFKQTVHNQEKVIADPERMLYSKALAVIEGYIDKTHDGYCYVTSDSLDVSDEIFEINHDKKYGNEKKTDIKFRNLNEVHFKAYYFIYNREEYYTNISKIELANILKLSKEQGGIRLYRNGFRVLPYGEPNDDWLNIDRRYYNESGTNAPFGNRNLFGFVEIIDPTGELFEETASREGIIENEAYKELIDFVHKALEAARNRLRYSVEKIKKESRIKLKSSKDGYNEPEKTTEEKLYELEKVVTQYTTDSGNDQNQKDEAEKTFKALKEDVQLLMQELGMLRVLAGLGLTIGEFTHEVVQFSPSILGDLSVLNDQPLNASGLGSLENLKRTINLFTSYTSYFNSTVSANVSRELKPQKLDEIVTNFKKIIDSDLEKIGIVFTVEYYGYDLVTVPMHSSEWSSILFNLYTNSKKAIRRESKPGRIKIVVGKENKRIYLEFSDNGDGIPEKNKQSIFEAFFTTSTPVGFDAENDEKLTGTGLGLKIIRDIIQSYSGVIELIVPESGYSTCFRIELPLASLNQLGEYEL